jgi:hypothetical protein
MMLIIDTAWSSLGSPIMMVPEALPISQVLSPPCPHLLILANILSVAFTSAHPCSLMTVRAYQIQRVYYDLAENLAIRDGPLEASEEGLLASPSNTHMNTTPTTTTTTTTSLPFNCGFKRLHMHAHIRSQAVGCFV